MYESFHLKGNLYRVRDPTDLHSRVIAVYPGAKRQGSTAHWTWAMGEHAPENFVAEAWAGRYSTSDWYLRIKDKD